MFALSARGVAWVLAWRLATRLLGLLSTLALVRLLAPADFGLVALASGVANAVEQFGWVGVEAAIVRERAPDRSVFDTGFTINLIRSLLLAAVIAVLAGPAAAFFEEPRLETVLLFLAAASACMGAENIGVVEFRRAFAFDREFRYLLIPRLLSIGLAIGTAVALRSYWALVVGIVSGRVLRVGVSYWVSGYRPRLTLRAWRVLAGTSSWMWLLGLAGLLRDRGDTLVIGRAMSTTAVGVYTIGFDFAALTFTELVEALQRPAFSGFVAARNRGERLATPLLRLIGSVCLLSVPAGVGLSLVAGPVIALVAGPGWVGAVPVVAVLALAGVPVVVGTVCRTLLTATGRFRTTAAVTVTIGVLRIAALALAIPGFGLTGAAAAAGGTMALEGAVFVGIVLRLEGIGPAEAAGPVWRPALAALTMAGVVWGCGLGWAEAGTAPWPALLEGIGLGAATYGSALLVLWSLAGRPAGAEADALRLVRARLGRRGRA